MLKIPVNQNCASVLEAIEQGFNTNKSLSLKFGASPETINRLGQRFRKQGLVTFTRTLGKGQAYPMTYARTEVEYIVLSDKETKFASAQLNIKSDADKVWNNLDFYLYPKDGAKIFA